MFLAVILYTNAAAYAHDADEYNDFDGDEHGDEDADEPSDRAFTFAYDAAPMERGERELEMQTTFSPGSTTGFDVAWRGELEVPISKRIVGSAYVNLSSGAHPFDGVSYEVKGTVLSPFTAPVGLALYGELSLRPDEVELEAKLILDRRFGAGTLLYNGGAERAWVKDLGGHATELTMKNDLALGWRVADSQLGLGAELNAPYTIDGGDSAGALFAGPALRIAPKHTGWSTNLSVLPRAVTFGPGPTDAQPWQLRVTFSAEL